MKSDVFKRLSDLEKKYKKDPLIITAETASGEIIQVNARELDNNPDLGFCGVVRGNDMKGLDSILAFFDRRDGITKEHTS